MGKVKMSRFNKTMKTLMSLAAKEAIWKGSESVKEAGVAPTTFQNNAEALVKAGIFKKQPQQENTKGRPKMMYELIKNG